jgi:hypothetical protein
VLRNLLISAIPAIFIAAKKNLVTGFGNVTCLQILTHLHDRYGQIMDKDLEDNFTRTRRPQSNLCLYRLKIEDGIVYTAENNDEPNKPTILRWAYGIVVKTGRYEITCREWRHFDGTNMTNSWDKFKVHFKAADMDTRIQETTGTVGYHNAAHAATKDAHAVNTALLTTTQTALAANKIVLA